MSEIRLVAMEVAGEFSKGGLKLVTVADSHRAAWDAGITEEEAQEIEDAILTALEHAGPTDHDESILAKLRSMFPSQGGESDG